MPKVDVETIATESSAKTWDEFVDNFQENVTTLASRIAIDDIQQDREYILDEDGYIVGTVWTEKIASELIASNNFIPTVERIQTLVEARAVYQQASIPVDYKIVAATIKVEAKDFLRMFPKFPIVYITRWGNLRKPGNLQELINNPVKR